MRSRALMKMLKGCGDVILPCATPVLKVIVALSLSSGASLTVVPSYICSDLRTERVERWAFSPTVFSVSRTEGESFPRHEVKLDGCVGKVAKDRLVLPQSSLRRQIKICIQRTLINVTNIQFFYFRSLPQSDM